MAKGKKKIDFMKIAVNVGSAAVGGGIAEVGVNMLAPTLPIWAKGAIQVGLGGLGIALSGGNEMVEAAGYGACGVAGATFSKMVIPAPVAGIGETDDTIIIDEDYSLEGIDVDNDNVMGTESNTL